MRYVPQKGGLIVADPLITFNTKFEYICQCLPEIYEWFSMSELCELIGFLND